VRKNAWLAPWTWKRTRASVCPRFSRNVSGLPCVPGSGAVAGVPPQALARIAKASAIVTDRVERTIACYLLRVLCKTL
jgi:hypothetical protein